MLTIGKRFVCVLILFFAAAVQAKPFSVSTDISISNGDWYPLPEQAMTAAAVDTALAELTKGGLFSIVDNNENNRLRLEISLGTASLPPPLRGTRST